MGNNKNPLLELSNALLKRNIKVCIWKNTNEVELAMQGKADLDILVNRVDFAQFKIEASRLNFIEASANIINYPFIYHFYAYDNEQGVLIHLHVHTRIMTGESHTKNFWLPYEIILLKNSKPNHFTSFLLPEPALLYWIHVIRFYLKISALPSIFLLIKKRSAWQQELTFIMNACTENPKEYILKNNIHEVLGISKSFALKLLNHFQLQQICWQKICLGLSLRRKIIHLNRYGYFKGIFHRYTQIIYRIANKLFWKQRKKLTNHGIIIALVGADGSGKSSIAHSLKIWLCKAFNVRLVHMGCPNTTALTFPHRLSKKFIQLVLRINAKDIRQVKNTKNQNRETKQDHMNLIKAIHYLCIAYERYRLGVQLVHFASRGEIIISDRYPSKNVGVMDSARIGTSHRNRFINCLGKYEKHLYNRIPKPDLLIQIKVSELTALQRNNDRIKERKESSNEIRIRHQEQSRLYYAANRLVEVSGEGNFTDTITQVKSIVWNNF